MEHQPALGNVDGGKLVVGIEVDRQGDFHDGLQVGPVVAESFSCEQPGRAEDPNPILLLLSKLHHVDLVLKAIDAA